MTRKLTGLAICCATALSTITPAQSQPQAWAAHTLGRAMAAYFAFESGRDIGAAIGSLDRGEIVGALSSTLGGRALFGDKADIGGLLAAEGLADLGRAADRFLAAPTDTRPLIERRMADVGLRYDDVGAGLDIRAPGGDLEYQILLHREVLDRLRAQAEASGESVAGLGQLEYDLAGLEANLAALRGETTAPAPPAPVSAPAPASSPAPPAPVSTPTAAPQPPSPAVTASVADLVTGGRWAMDPGNRLPSGLRGAYICETDGPPRGHCFVVGCGPEPAGLDFFMIAPSMIDHGHRDAIMRIDGGAGIPMQFRDVPEVTHLFFGTFPNGGGPELLALLRAGNRAELVFETGYALFVYSSGLAGSSAAIGEAERLCSSPAASSPAEAVPGSPAEAVASFVIDQVCDGRGGQIDPRGLFEADLDRNGRLDVIVDEDGISCNGSAAWERRPLSCGAQFCDFQVYLDIDGTLTQSLVGHGTVTGVGTEQTPIVDTVFHGGNRVRYQWNGSGFSQY